MNNALEVARPGRAARTDSARRWLAALALGIAAAGVAQAEPLRPGYNRDVIYQVFVDRFFDGSNANNYPGDPLYDASGSNLQKYLGGDFQGLTAKIGYLGNLGVSAIWVTSPLDNRNLLALAGSTAPYHGYEMRDTQLPDEHFTTASQSWQPFDDFVAAAHAAGIKVIVDFAPNHSNVRGSGEDGALYANGALQANYASNPGGFFQTGPNMGGAQWDSPYETQYYTIYDLADLNQQNASVDALLKGAVANLQNHGVDGFRLDATKHVNWGWQYSLANSAYGNRNSFVFGEWVADDSNNPLYRDMLKFSNRSGVAALNFPLFTAITRAFAQGGSFTALNGVIAQQQTDFAYPNDLVNFVDNHDRKRFLSVDTSADERKHLHAALAFVLTARGIPCIYYGSEQYLEGGDDPDNRRRMPGFDQSSTAFQLVKALSTLRANNEALGYGSIAQRWINQGVFVFERRFNQSVVVVAINKGSSAQTLSGLVTSLPTGNHGDYLGGLLGGVTLTATGATSGGYGTVAPTLPANSVSVWSRDPAVSVAQLGNVTPSAAQPGVRVVLAGQGFGASQGTVRFGGVAATISSWNDRQVVATVPNIGQGVKSLTVTRSGSSTASNALNFGVYQARLVPVTFTVNNAAPTNPGDQIYLTGDTLELGNWSATASGAVGAMLTTAGTYPNWWLTVAVPAGRTLQFKFLRIRADGSVTWENGGNHSVSTPASGVGSVNVNWQY
ncbi:MAG: IPT/TIG domain-containing protein [Xanthomonadales bacterium]|nr:IPT/TIG domain-containing protein [Xanthomonadales bacterium]